MSTVRSNRKAVLGGSFILILVAIAAMIWLTGDGMRPAPAFAATTLDGEPGAPEDYTGRPVMTSFSATSCPSCLREIPELVQLHKTYAGQGFELLALALP